MAESRAETILKGKAKVRNVEIKIAGRKFNIGKLGARDAIAFGINFFADLSDEKKKEIARKLEIIKKAKGQTTNEQDMMVIAGTLSAEKYIKLLAIYLGTDDIKFIDEYVGAGELSEIIGIFCETNDLQGILKNAFRVMASIAKASQPSKA